MRPSTPHSPGLRRTAAAVLAALMLAPAAGFAEDEKTEGEAADQPAVPVEKHWYDTLVRNTDIGVDLIVIRPLAAITLAAGAILFVPAAVMTAPNGKDSLLDAYGRFVREPGEYFYSRPLGEF
jgi:hypothetical protein